jgi:hypothetical protein
MPAGLPDRAACAGPRNTAPASAAPRRPAGRREHRGGARKDEGERKRRVQPKTAGQAEQAANRIAIDGLKHVSPECGLRQGQGTLGQQALQAGSGYEVHVHTHTHILSLSLCVSLCHTHTHTHTHAHAHTRTRTHARTHTLTHSHIHSYTHTSTHMGKVDVAGSGGQHAAQGCGQRSKRRTVVLRAGSVQWA